MSKPVISCLFSDVGGVLGSNGWDSALRQRTTAHFGCDHQEVDARHRLVFDSYERGYLTLDEYLRRVFFASERAFTLQSLREFVLQASTPWSHTIAALQAIKKRNGLRLGLISNEGETLTQFRVERFGLAQLADFMIFSYFVHMRKPDPAIWRLALNLVQVSARECIYLDDRALFAEIAADLGFHAIHHTSLESTEEKLRSFGLEV